MANTALLRFKLEQSGYKMGFVATKIGLSRQGFANKLNNKTEFRVSEIQILCKLLSLQKNERESIFFYI